MSKAHNTAGNTMTAIALEETREKLEEASFILDRIVRAREKESLERRIMEHSAHLTELNERLRREIGERERFEQALRKSEKEFKALADNALVGIYRSTISGKFLYANQAMAEMYGFNSVDELASKNVISRYRTPNDREGFIRKLKKHRSVSNYEIEALAKDGTIKNVLLNATLEGNIITGMVLDISARKQTEEKLQESEIFSTSLLERAPNPIFVINPNSSVRYVNPAFEKLTGFSNAELSGIKPPFPWWPKNLEADFKRALKHGANRVERFFQKKDGEKFWVEITATPLQKSGKNIHYLANWVDITERKKLEGKLRQLNAGLEEKIKERTRKLHESEKKYHHIYDKATVTILEEDYSQVKLAINQLQEKRVKDFNMYFKEHPEEVGRLAKMARIVGANNRALVRFEAGSKKELLGSLDRIFVSKSRGMFKKVLLAMLEGKQNIRFEDTAQTLKGNKINVLVSIFFPQKELEFDKVLVSIMDISKRKRAELALEKSRASLAEAQRIARLGNWDWDIKSNKLYWSDEIYLIFGLKPQEFGATYEAFLHSVHPDDRERVNSEVQAALSGKKPYSIDHRILLPDGSERIVHERAKVFYDNKGVPVKMVGTVQEVTKQREAEKRTRASNVLLELLTKKFSRKEYLNTVVRLIQRWSGCRCVGVRVLDKQGALPYESYRGFDKEFWEAENWLSVHNDQCTCIRVVAGRAESQDLPMMTAFGSFYCTDTKKFMKALTRTEKERFRGTCVRRGFATVAVIPLRYRDQAVGVLHLADERSGRLTGKVLEFLESIAPLIGEVIHRFYVEEELRYNYATQQVVNRLLRLSLSSVSLDSFLESAFKLLLSVSWLSLERKGALFLAEENSSHLVLKAQHGLPIPLQKKYARVSFDGCSCGRSASSKKVSFADHAAGEHKMFQKEIVHYGHYCAPLIHAGGMLGVVTLYVKEGHRSDEKEKQFLSIVADALAGTIQRKRTETARREAEEKVFELYRHLGVINRRVSILLDVSRARGNGDSGEIIRYIAASAKSISGAASCVLYRYDQDEKSFFELSSEKNKSVKVPVDSSVLLQRLVQTQTRVHGTFEDFKAKQQKLSNFDNQIHNIFGPAGEHFRPGARKFRYGIFLPLALSGKLEGAIFLGFDKKREISTQEFDFYDAFALQTSLALHNPGTFQE